MAAVLPLVGFVASGGSWKAALRYTLAWVKYMLIITAIGVAFAIFVIPLTD